jgi:hypothetical protein
MTKQERELQDPGNWDWDKAEVSGPLKTQRTIVSVAFPRKEFMFVATCARKLGLPVSAFIRNAAIEKAQTQAAVWLVTWTSGNRGQFNIQSIPQVQTEGALKTKLEETRLPSAVESVAFVGVTN